MKSIKLIYFLLIILLIGCSNNPSGTTEADQQHESESEPSTNELETIANVLNNLDIEGEVTILDSYKLPESSYQDYKTAWCIAVSSSKEYSPLIMAEGEDGWMTQVTELAQSDCQHTRDYFENHPSATMIEYIAFVFGIKPEKTQNSPSGDGSSDVSPEQPQAPNLPIEHPLYGNWIMVGIDEVVYMELLPDGSILQYEEGKEAEGFRGIYTILSENILEFGEGTGWYPGEYQYLVNQDQLIISREGQVIEYYRQGSVQPEPTWEPDPTAVPDQPDSSPGEAPPQSIFLRPSCGKSYTVQAGVPLKLLYGAWGAKGNSLIRETMSSIQVDLYLDGEYISGSRVDGLLGMADLPCGDYLEDSYWIIHSVDFPSLSEGEYDIDVSFTFLDEITDGYDLNEDGKLDQYGPQSSFHQEYRLIVTD